jgi:hypothetical protein
MGLRNTFFVQVWPRAGKLSSPSSDSIPLPQSSRAECRMRRVADADVSFCNALDASTMCNSAARARVPESHRVAVWNPKALCLH